MAHEFTPGSVAQALGVPAPTSKGAYSAIITDSRKIQPGCLFVCIKGEKFDAHDFIGQAIQQGATGILCRTGTPILPGAHFFQVEDTLTGFRKLAHVWRRQFSIPLIAVAGSVGKTTTKEILSAILRGKYSTVLKTEGSQNGYVGIPMTLLELRATHEAAVIEVGIDEIGAMKQHMTLVAATGSLLTAIGPEHLEKLRDIPTVASEEGLALTIVATSGGFVAINMDDEWIRPYDGKIRSQKITFGLDHPSATVHGKYLSDEEAVEIGKVKYSLPLPGTHNARNFLAALAVATKLGLTPEEVKKGLQTFMPAEGRSVLKQLGNLQVICDYYNANPTSTLAGLELLSKTAKKTNSKARFACLADMAELGSGEERFHRDLAPALLHHGIEHIYLFGKKMKWLVDELGKRGYSGDLQHFEKRDALAGQLVQALAPGDAILIKGSHSMQMEEIWKSLEKCPRKF